MEDMLPEYVMFDVLSRLPVKTIIYCKCVCKRWRCLVADPYFVHLHLSRSREALIFQERTVEEVYNGRPGTLKWVEIKHLNLVKSLNLKCGERIGLSGSVNGLVSCWAWRSRCIYIFNPLLEQYIILPQLPSSLGRLLFGFGVSTAREYKVFRVCIRLPLVVNLSEIYLYASQIEVYTLGTNKWRVLEQTLKVDLVGRPPHHIYGGVYLNSHMYWLIGGKIYDFDFTTETFESFPSAPSVSLRSKKMLGVLKGSLSQTLLHTLAGIRGLGDEGRVLV